jgi:hypothetical protein
LIISWTEVVSTALICGAIGLHHAQDFIKEARAAWKALRDKDDPKEE